MVAPVIILGVIVGFKLIDSFLTSRKKKKNG